MSENKCARILSWSLFCSIVLMSAIFLVCGCASIPPKIVQVSTIDALLGGAYDGVMPIGELKRHGDFGIGTVDHLDGELLVLNGKAYHVRADGVAYLLPDDATVPFASVVYFKATSRKKMSGIANYASLIAGLDRELPNKNIMVAFRLRGDFKKVKTRSVPRQEKPYRPLAEITKHQPEFNLSNVRGTLIGFRLPPYVKGLNVPGWHLHFIDESGKAGGHVLNLELDKGVAEFCEVFDFQLMIPRNSEAFRKMDLSLDRGKELRKVESDIPSGYK